MQARRGKNHAVGQGKLGVNADPRRTQCDAQVEVDHRALLHDGNSAQGAPLVPLLQYSLEHLVDCQQGNDKLIRLLDGASDHPVCLESGQVLGTEREPLLVDLGVVLTEQRRRLHLRA